MSENLPTLGSTSFLTASSSAPSPAPSTLILSSQNSGDTATRHSSATSATGKPVSGGESPSITKATTETTGNGVLSQGAITSHASSSANPAATLSTSPTSIVGVVLGGVARSSKEDSALETVRQWKRKQTPPSPPQIQEA
ncbi:hypothetical protein E4U21_001616 [Claviceps maximensis]|nr:hypothetical protein E4U21_001616 [Claviceps maximensis]